MVTDVLPVAERPQPQPSDAMNCMRIIAAVLVTLAWALPTNAQSSDVTAKRSHHLPHIADGDGWRSLVLVTNVASSASRCTLELHGLSVDRFKAMSGVAASGSTATFELPGSGGFLVWPTRNELAVASGYATLDCSAPVAAQVVFASVGRSGEPTGMATVLSSQSGTVFQIPLLTPAGTLGFAFENDTNADAFCRLVLETPQRENQGEAPLSIPSKSNLAAMLRDAISIPEGFPGGTATITCNQPVAMIGLHFELEPDGTIITFTTLPPTVLDTSPQTVLSPEREALEAFYDATGGSSWNNRRNWRTSAPLSEWHGVRTNSAGRVVELKLDNNRLSGSIPPELGKLVHLQHLDLSNNDLSGPIPPELGNLTGLQQLLLSYNALTGELPMSLTNLRQLSMLWFNGNQGLCMPSTSPFAEWLTGIASVEGPTCGTSTMPGTDRAALEALYDAAGGPNWHESRNWKTSAPLDEWAGVGVDSDGRVIALQLPFNNLGGMIPAELGNLTRLEQLRLFGNNNLSGPIPAELGNLIRLKRLDLDRNDLSGSIPAELGKLTSLQRLDLGGNNLSGPIPAALGNLGGLQRLLLDRNNLNGSIPAELGKLTHLRELVLLYNRLSGPIPAELGNLTRLELLSVSFNRLSGELPESLTNLRSLRGLYFGDNATLCAPSTSAFAAWLGGIAEVVGPTCGPPMTAATDRAALEAFYDATGGPSWKNSTNWKTAAPLGMWHGVATDLAGRVTRLELGDNGLRGAISAELGNLTRLERLSLWGNNLSGPIPAELGKLHSLRDLWLWANDLSGPIPVELGRLITLTSLLLRNNNLSGPVPHELGNLTELDELTLSFNRLSGELPWTLRRLQQMRVFRFEENDGLCSPSTPEFTAWLSGIAELAGPSCTVADTPEADRLMLEAFYDVAGGPNWRHRTNWKTSAALGEWYGVETDADGRVVRLNLDSNNVIGPIPADLGNLTRLERLDLEGNGLSGPIPAELGNLALLQRLDLDSNNLTGAIPSELGGLTSLELLDLDANSLSGPIPVELGNLTSLELLDLSHNNLSEPIPAELGNLALLQRLDLSRNSLTGPIPSELGRLTGLELLDLSRNNLSGQLPSLLTNLQDLLVFKFDYNQGLCAPSTLAFRSWLRQIDDVSGPMCGTDGTVNHPPEPVGRIGDVTVQVGGSEESLSVGEYFHDPDGDRLFYSVSITPEGRVRAGMEAVDTLVIQAVVTGTGKVTVTARDPGGLAARQTIDVTVLPADTNAETDRQALEALYDAVGGASWYERTNWKTSAPLEDWYGVSTDRTGRVIKLELPYNNVSGPIPDALGHLTLMRELDLDGNQVSGPIPAALGNLTNLQELSLGLNRLSGPIPATLSLLTYLRRLNLRRNELSGAIPVDLGNLFRLEQLDLSDNHLSGVLPSSLTKMRDLRRFWFHDNAGLCAPSTPDFQAWLNGIALVEGPTCGSSSSSAMLLVDRQVPEALYAASGGTHGFRRANWKASLGDWFGMKSDGDGDPLPFRKENKRSQETP